MIAIKPLRIGSGLINPGSFAVRTPHGWTVCWVAFGRRAFLAYRWPNRWGFALLWLEANVNLDREPPQ